MWFITAFCHCPKCRRKGPWVPFRHSEMDSGYRPRELSLAPRIMEVGAKPKRPKLRPSGPAYIERKLSDRSVAGTADRPGGATAGGAAPRWQRGRDPGDLRAVLASGLLDGHADP